MASFWQRIGDILQSNVNDWLTKMEDPEKMLPLRIDQMKQDLAEATDATAEAMAVSKQTEMRLADIKFDLKKYNDAAQQALAANKEELAKKCMARVITLEKQQKSAEEAYTRQTELNVKLKDVIAALKAKIEEAEVKMDELIARSKAAKAQERVIKTMGNINVVDIGATFDELEQRVIKKENKVSALSELGSAANSLDDEIASIGEEDEIKKRLQQLKGK
ncbi:MAG: PspA/IM30 family protein [Caldisericales bacterium]|nr:PspA/IM30 family protein [bacterium]